MILAVPALAVPIGPGETYQEWGFDDDANPAIPTIDLNPYGEATATISSTAAGAPPKWLADALDREGVWTAEGRLEVILDVPNQMIRNPYKEITVEIAFNGAQDVGGFAVYTNPLSQVVELVDRTIDVAADGWAIVIDKYYIEPNPDHEWINYHWLGDLIAVDYVKVSTICVPEPLTIGLLGFGGLMLRRRRKA
jgi:hypothetical protein